MTITADRQDATPDIDVVFEEARPRRRRWRIGLAVVLAAGVATLVPILTGGGGRRLPPRFAHSAHRPGISTPPPTINHPPVVTVPSLNRPDALAVAPNGDLLIDNSGSDQILERSPSGALSVLIGPADGLSNPGGMAVGTDGSIYVADTGSNRILVLAPSGVVTTLASVYYPTDVAISPSGLLYVSDRAGIQTVQSNGLVTTLLPATTSVHGTVENDVTIDGTPNAFFPDAIAISSSGDLYIADFSPKLVLRYSDGVLSLVGQVDSTYVCQHGLAAAPDGSIVVGDYGRFGLDRIAGSTLSPFAIAGIGALTPITGGFRPSGVAVAPNGEVYASNDGAGGATNQQFLIAVDPDGTVHLLSEVPT